jgi:soluble lytic murein transglycosylase
MKEASLPRAVTEGSSATRYLSGAVIFLILAVALQASTGAAVAVQGERSTRIFRSGPADTVLHKLSAQAGKRTTWPALRRYAEKAKAPEERGRAYLVLGYNEYDAHQYAPAAADLARAAAIRFQFADFAAYYEAAASQTAERPLQAIQALQDFSVRYPGSLLTYKALELLGQALLKANQPARLIELASKEPKVRERIGLQLLLARALWQAERLEEAARAFQDVYYNFPTSAEANVAAAALKNLQARLAQNFPSPTVEQHTRRAELTFKAARWDAALGEYDALLQGPHSIPQADGWKVRRVRCLVYLKRAQQALDSLAAGDWQNSQANSDRLATLALAYQQLNNQPQMLQQLDELRKNYPQSAAYADALWSTGNFFLRQGDWKSAVRYYQPLAASFPQDLQGRESCWRVAWNHYLEGETDQARQSFQDYLTRYPGSPHTAAALYWLGRLAEARSDESEARDFYDLVRGRFPQGYYSRQASLRLNGLRLGSAAQAPPAEPRVNASGTPGLAASIAPQLGQRKPLSSSLCVSPTSAASNQTLRPFMILRTLSLNELAEEYLRETLARGPRDPELLLALSRFDKQQGNVSAALFDCVRLVPNYSDYKFTELPREVWRLLYPEAYWNLVRRQARLNRLDPYLVMGLIRQESAFNPKATSVANARGLMQMMPQTAARSSSLRRQRLAGRKLYDPGYNIRAACRYLRQVISAFQGNLEESLAAYNAGDSRVRQWLHAHSFRDPPEFLESIPFHDTRYYVEALLRDAAIYRQMIGGRVGYKRCG